MNAFKRNSRFGGKRSETKPPFRRSGVRPHATMYPAVCSKCGNACEVPFRPDGQRPISCKDCFVNTNVPERSERSERPREFPQPVYRAPASSQVPDPRIDEIQRNLAKIQVQLERIIVGIAASKPKKSTKED